MSEELVSEDAAKNNQGAGERVAAQDADLVAGLTSDDDQPCPDPRCNEMLGAMPIPQCVTAVRWAEDSMSLQTVAEAARDFMWEPENSESYESSKTSNSVAWPPEFLLLGQAVEKKYGAMPLDDPCNMCGAKTVATHDPDCADNPVYDSLDAAKAAQSTTLQENGRVNPTEASESSPALNPCSACGDGDVAMKYHKHPESSSSPVVEDEEVRKIVGEDVYHRFVGFEAHPSAVALTRRIASALKAVREGGDAKQKVENTESGK